MTDPVFDLPPQQRLDGTTEQLPAGGPAQTSQLSELLDELNTEMPVKTKTWDTPRAGWAATFRLDLAEPDYDRAKKAATTKKGSNGRPDEVSEVRLLCLLLAQYNTALTRRGEVVEVGGEPFVFSSHAFLETYHAARAADAVKTFYGSDGAVIAAGRAFTDACGWTSEPDEVSENPTHG